MQWIDWSPDGQWIVYGSAYYAGQGWTVDIYSTNLEGKVTNFLLGETSALEGPKLWINDHQFIDYITDWVANSHLRMISVENGGIVTVWKGHLNDLSSFIAFDPQYNLLAFNTKTENKEIQPSEDYLFQYDQAIYLFSPNTLENKRIGDCNLCQIEFLGTGNIRFYVSGNLDDSISKFITADGKIIEANLPLGTTVYASSNHIYWIATSDRVQIYSSNDLMREVNFPDGASLQDLFQDQVTWRPDSSGLFFITWFPSRALYALDIMSGEIYLVEANLSDWPIENYAWVNNK
jgi:hypothetical protein